MFSKGDISLNCATESSSIRLSAATHRLHLRNNFDHILISRKAWRVCYQKVSEPAFLACSLELHCHLYCSPGSSLGHEYVSWCEYSGTSLVTGHEANSCQRALLSVPLPQQPLQKSAIVMYSNPSNLLSEILLC